MPVEKAYLDYPEVPDDLLQPLTGDSHGGQVVMMPGGVQVEIDEEIESKGVVFTDLKTAEEEYPHVLSKIMGKVVSAEDGKFAAMTAALRKKACCCMCRAVCTLRSLSTVCCGAGKIAFIFLA